MKIYAIQWADQEGDFGIIGLYENHITAEHILTALQEHSAKRVSLSEHELITVDSVAPKAKRGRRRGMPAPALADPAGN